MTKQTLSLQSLRATLYFQKSGRCFATASGVAYFSQIRRAPH